jgi:CRISPR/Cas system-associated exonuclease Cas4 (RecB family)
MSAPRAFEIFESASAAARLEAAASVLRRLAPTQSVAVVGASRGAADDLVRRVARERTATVGLARFSLTQLAAQVAAARLAADGIAPSTSLGAEAIAARAAFDAARDGRLSYFSRVADTPGFPRALARTISELRAVHASSARVASSGAAGEDLARLFDRIEREFRDAASADRARLFAVAADAFAEDSVARASIVLLDVAVESPAEEQFVRAITTQGRTLLATIPAHDENTRDALARGGGQVTEHLENGNDDLTRLRRHLFAGEPPPQRALQGALAIFSAPGEGRESVEIARRILKEARDGVRFDQMAVLVRTPQQYHGLLEHALERAGIPAWFDRGTRRPHPAGRAFLALLACAAEKLSARRFAEYLSLGQLPAADTDLDAPALWVPSADEVFGRAAQQPVDEDRVEDEVWASEDAPREDQRVVAGTLRAPRHWERLLVEASVIGGDPARWQRRLQGRANEFRAQLEEVTREDADSAKAAAITRDLARLENLTAYAVPLMQELAGWPISARWGEWLERLQQLAPRVLRVPTYVLRVLADLHPMSDVGPVTLEEVRGVLTERLRTVDAEPPARRYGRVFVGTPAQARGRAFRVVFVPGLAERMFPQKPRQDPMLLDAARDMIDSALPTMAARSREERLLLHLAVGAATERLYLSYPRLDVVEARPRVPSFYALDVLRGATGRIPHHDELTDWAASAADATLAWPAPTQPDMAIDDQEHDLSVLRRLLDTADPAQVRGHAHYMLRLNPALKRAVSERWARGERKWSTADGLIRLVDRTRQPLIEQRLHARPYSLSALQRYTSCPYQFLLSAVYRLHASEQPQPLQRMDPLTRGSLVHKIQAMFFAEMNRRGALPVTSGNLDAALDVLSEVTRDVSESWREWLVPAIERVWGDEVGVIARDLRGWLRGVAADGAEWTPAYFELAFGLPHDAERDPHSVADPVILEDRFKLRGSVDLVEVHRATGQLRVTDHKTGKNRSTPGMVIGGGAVLQPVLYSMVVEQVMRRPVRESRLSYCTSAGGFTVFPIALDANNRRLGLEALEIIDRAIETGSLAAAPAEGACEWCDFRAVCGPNEEQRTSRKPKDRLRDLIELRIRP